MRRLVPLLALFVAIAGYWLIFPDVWNNRKDVRAKTPAGYIIPSKFSRILALGNQGVLSDFLFLKTSTFVGGRGMSGQMMEEEDWDFVVRSLGVVTDLDPYFVDPYVLAEGLLAWDAGKIEAANQLLEKGMRYRTKDWRLPFYVGFNHFYFLKDFQTASGFIMQAAELPGSPSYLKTLGARLAYYGGKTKTALLFLKEMLADAKDPLLKKRLDMRLKALEGSVVIEEALERYRHDNGNLPTSLNDLLLTGYLVAFPVDPYGGEWVFRKDGRVFSTSKFVEKRKE